MPEILIAVAIFAGLALIRMFCKRHRDQRVETLLDEIKSNGKVSHKPTGDDHVQ